MKSNNRIVCWKILSGTLPTNLNRTRGRANINEKMCRHCGSHVETDLHILAECGWTKDLQNIRHNKICDKIAKELKIVSSEATIQRERTWRVGMTNLKPDITMTINEKMIFIRVTVPYEKDLEVLARREDKKEKKYARLTSMV